jgi:hypothetical protein
MKIKKYYTVRKVPKTNCKIIEAEEKLIPIIQIYMTRAFKLLITSCCNKINSNDRFIFVLRFNKINNKKYHTIRTIPKSNCLIVNRGQTDDPSVQQHI